MAVRAIGRAALVEMEATIEPTLGTIMRADILTVVCDETEMEK